MTDPRALLAEAEALLARRATEEARVAFERVLEVDPRSAEAHHGLGLVLVASGKLDEGAERLEAARALAPDWYKPVANLGNLARKRGALPEAAARFERALELEPQASRVRGHLVAVLRELGRREEALRVACGGTEVAPIIELADEQARARAHSSALDGYRRALELDPRNPDARYASGTSLVELGDPAEGLRLLARAREVAPDWADAESAWLFVRHYVTEVSAEESLRDHRAWASRHAPLEAPKPAPTPPVDPDRRLRVAYVSGDFHNHPVARFLAGPLAERDRAQLEVHCLYDGTRRDPVTEHLARLVDGFESIAGLSNDAFAARVRALGVDVLVDLSGHTNGQRLRAFALRPAPVQVTWLGYPDTTGLAAIEHRLTDARADPAPEGDTRCSERVYRLPSAWCYTPFEAPSEPGAIPSDARGHVTFGSFNHLAKLSDETLDAWAGVLARVEGSRLFVKAAGLGDALGRRRLAERLAARGVDEVRLELRGWEENNRAHVELYEQVDVALDTFPYAGTTTTCEALYKGVPVVTRAGRSHASRVGASLLSSVGLTELVTTTAEGFVVAAARIAEDVARRRELRRTLRATLRASPLGDARAFARSLEAAYRAMWREVCAAHG